MKLNRREKTFVGLGAAILACLALYLWVIEPLADHRDRLRKSNARVAADLAEMKALAVRYKTLAAERDRLKRQVSARGAGFAPFSHLETLARESGLTGQIESMAPAAGKSEDLRPGMAEFDVRLAGIGLPQLVQFLHRLESSDKVFFVINLTIRPRYLTPDLLDVTLRLATPAAS